MTKILKFFLLIVMSVGAWAQSVEAQVTKNNLDQNVD